MARPATVVISDEDFYGGRTGPLEKFHLFIYFLLKWFRMKISTVAGRAIRKILFIYLFFVNDFGMKISTVAGGGH